MTLMEELKSRGWDVHLLVTNARGDHFDELKRTFHCHDLSEVALSPKSVHGGRACQLYHAGCHFDEQLRINALCAPID